jgi:EAL and modified HD-GYP domain-containing signal transduction protein
MPNGPRTADSSDAPESEAAIRPHFVARLPILDLRGRVHAFKLLIRGGSESEKAEPAGRILAETAAHYGLEKPSELKKLTGNMPAFVRCPGDALSEPLERTLPASLTVLEITPSPEPAPELVSTCERLKALGFRLALDDFTGQPANEALLDLADYIKVDFGRTGPENRRELFHQLHGKAPAMLARNVETQAAYRQAREEGFALFEGYYFCEPVAKRNRRPPANQLMRIEILQALQQHPLEVHKVSELVKRDGPLTYQLLRLANSPLWAVAQEVKSIQTALLAVGDDAFRRIATLAIATEFNGDQTPELLCMVMVRGRFCEVAGLQCDLDPFEQYLLGLLSLLPAMQGQPMSELAPTMPVRQEIREALMGAKNRERALLGWLEKYERGDWAGCDAAARADGLDQEQLAKAYLEAVAWAEAALHSGG